MAGEEGERAAINVSPNYGLIANVQHDRLVHRCVDPDLQSETAGQLKNQAAVVSSTCLFYLEAKQQS